MNIDAHKAKRWIKRITVGCCVVSVLFFTLMIIWHEYYEHYLFRPDVENVLGIDLHGYQEMTHYIDRDVEIGKGFGDCAGVYLLVGDSTISNSITEQLLGKGWIEVDPGIKYNFERPIHDYIAQLGCYGANWYPQEGMIDYYAVVITEKPFSILFSGLYVMAIVVVVLIITWIVLLKYEYRTKNQRI